MWDVEFSEQQSVAHVLRQYKSLAALFISRRILSVEPEPEKINQAAMWEDKLLGSIYV